MTQSGGWYDPDVAPEDDQIFEPMSVKETGDAYARLMGLPETSASSPPASATRPYRHPKDLDIPATPRSEAVAASVHRWVKADFPHLTDEEIQAKIDKSAR